MKSKYRAKTAFAFIICLPCTPAWAHSATVAVNLSADSPVMLVDTVNTAGTSFLSNPTGWDLSKVGIAAAERPVESGALLSTFGTLSPPDHPAGYMKEADAVSGAALAPGLASGSPVPLDRSGHVPREYASHRGIFQQAGSSTTEIALFSGYVLAQGIPKLFKPTTSFHFKDEGWFGKGTQNVGMDKLTHAFNTYLIAEILHYRLHRNTDGSEGDAITAGVVAAGLMALNEVSDAIEPDSGYSMQDIAMNVAGATFSVLRNTVPGLKEKVAFKIEIMPNDEIYSRRGKPHYAQQRFMFSLKGAGFQKLDQSPLRYVDLQAGYYATNFLNSDRDKGITPKRHLFVGIGLNLGELLFGTSRSRIGRAARSVLDYVQLPYTSLRYDSTGRVGN